MAPDTPCGRRVAAAVFAAPIAATAGCSATPTASSTPERVATDESEETHPRSLVADRFFRDPLLAKVRLSPDGEHVAAVFPVAPAPAVATEPATAP